MSYLSKHGTRRVPQWLPLRGQVANSAGGHAWAVDVWTRLRRFLILGSEGGSYYASEWTLTRENAQAVETPFARTACARSRRSSPSAVRAERRRTIRRSTHSRSPRASVTTRHGRLRSRRCRRSPARARTCSSSRRSSRASAAGAARCGGPLPAGTPISRSEALAYQAVKYRQRAGVSHRDLLRLAHPAGRVGAGNPTVDVSADHARLFEWIVRGGIRRVSRASSRASHARSRRRLRRRRRSSFASIGLPREALQPEHLTSPEVWDALLDDMPMTALIRNLATMTRVGVIAPGSDGTARAIAQLGDRERLRRGSRSPDRGPGGAAHVRDRPRCSWPRHVGPVREIVDALDAAFYASFGNVEPAGKRLLLALDVSGSMACGRGRRRSGADTAGRIGGARARHGGNGEAVRDRRLLRRSRRLPQAGPQACERLHRRPDAARDLAAPAAGRRGAGRSPTCRSAAPTARCRCSTRWRASERSTRS